MKITHILFLFIVFSFTVSYGSSNDFCVADLKAPNTPSGYACKPLASVTSDDFSFHGLVAGNTNNSFKIGVATATVTNFPALNGLGISALRIDLDQGGLAPMHTHPDATELLSVVKGEITAGFLTPTSFYSKVLKPGDVFVFPQGMLHFAVNSGKGKATAFGAFSSENPTTHILDVLLFENKLPSGLVSQTTLLDLAQVKKLKAKFGGSG